MTGKAISPLRQRMIEDMTVRSFDPRTQSHYIRYQPFWILRGRVVFRLSYGSS
jgi:hypothetical protein